MNGKVSGLAYPKRKAWVDKEYLLPTKEELLAHGKNINEMTKHIKATSLKFLSLDGLYLALVGERRNIIYPQFSDHYFTGDYPIKPSDKLKGLKVKQLSLLSGKSNS